MGWLLANPVMEGEVVLAGHRNGTDSLNTAMAFATIERLMVREARESQAAVRILADFEDSKKEEWAVQVRTQLDDAAADFGSASTSSKTLRGIRNLEALVAAQKSGNFAGL